MNKLTCEISKKNGILLWVLDLRPLEENELVDTAERILREFVVITEKKKSFDFNGVVADCVEAKKLACAARRSDEELQRLEETSRKRLSELCVRIVEK